MAGIAAGIVDLVLTDLPYGVTDCAWDVKIALGPLWREYRRVLAPGGVVALFATFPFSAELVAAAPQGWARYDLVWDKRMVTGAGFSHFQPMWAHEEVLVFYARRGYYRPQGLVPFHKLKRPAPSEAYRGFPNATVQRFTGYPRSILRFARDAGGRLAAGEKPVALLDWLIRTYSPEGGLVLDSTMGLGSTGVAAAGCGRRFIGIEIDRARFDVARRRVRAAVRRYRRDQGGETAG
jgi:site-specific DNA-methyltransferase (adenine-specific)